MVLWLKVCEVLRALMKLLGRAQPVLPTSGYDPATGPKIIRSLLSRYNIVCFQSAMLDLYYREPGILLACLLLEAGKIMTRHSILLGSNNYCPIVVISSSYKILSLAMCTEKWYSRVSSGSVVHLVRRALHNLSTNYLYGTVVQMADHLSYGLP